MSNKLVRKQKEIPKQGYGGMVVLIIVTVVGVMILLGVTVVSRQQKQEPIIYPEAIRFSYNPETGEVEAEELGEEFEWSGCNNPKQRGRNAE